MLCFIFFELIFVVVLRLSMCSLYSFLFVHQLQPDLLVTLQKKRTSTVIPNEFIDEQYCIRVATEAFIKELGLDDGETLRGKVEIREVTAGTYLMKEDSNKVRFAYIFLR